MSEGPVGGKPENDIYTALLILATILTTGATANNATKLIPIATDMTVLDSPQNCIVCASCNGHVHLQYGRSSPCVGPGPNTTANSTCVPARCTSFPLRLPDAMRWCT